MCYARSSPIVLACSTDASYVVGRHRHRGTSMPSGGVHPINAGLEPNQLYVLALSAEASGGGILQPLAAFMTNPAGAAVVNAIGPIRQLVQDGAGLARRTLVIAPGTATAHGAPVQVQQ